MKKLAAILFLGLAVSRGSDIQIVSSVWVTFQESTDLKSWTDVADGTNLVLHANKDVALYRGDMRTVVFDVSWGDVPEAAGYRIYAGGVSGKYSACVTVGKVTSARVTYDLGAVTTKLNDGHTTFLSCTAFDDQGNESDFSPEIVRHFEDPRLTITKL